ncbi:MAG: glycine betaine/L-proline ABC transporter ATP-binding protein [Rhodovibrionaceae bacterium]
MTEPILSCRGVWKLFGPSPKAFLREHGDTPTAETIREAGYIGAVRNASLDVREGEILIIMGLSGSGKSTIVRCLSRLIEPTGGEIFFEGRNLLGISDRELIEIRRHKMGMVFQHFALLPHRTVLENVAFPLEVQGIDRGARDARAREMIKLVSLEGREAYYPRELSGGQQQRVGIARSLAVGPELWFLDEPFSALDPLIRREMQDEFLRLQSLLKKTIVFITHDFDEAIRLADRIAIMYEGEIVQLGTPEELITNPATDYVAEFTKDVARDKILTVGAVMEPMEAGAKLNGTSPLAVKDPLASIARRVLSSDSDLPVVDREGRLVGRLGRERLIDVIYGSG